MKKCRREGRRGLPGVVALLVWVAPTGPNANASEPEFVLATSGCGVGSEQALHRFVALQLGESASDAHASSDGVRALVTCVGDVAEIVITDPASSKVSLRRVPLVDVAAPSHARVAAIAVFELMAASWFELSSPELVRPPGWGPSLDATAEHGANGVVTGAKLSLTRGSPTGPSLTVSGQVLGALRGLGSVSGGSFGVSREPAASGFVTGLELGGALGSVRFPTGKVSAKLGGLRGELGWRWRRDLLFVDTALSVGAGWAWLNGVPDDRRVWSGRHEGPWAAAAARVAVGLALRPLAPSLSVEAGEVWRPVGGMIREKDVGMADTWVGVKLKLAWRGKRWLRW